MKVYIVIAGDLDDGSYVMGVFGNRVDAENEKELIEDSNLYSYVFVDARKVH